MGQVAQEEVEPGQQRRRLWAAARWPFPLVLQLSSSSLLSPIR